MDLKEYEELLDKGFSELPEIIKKKERFVIPLVKGRIERNRTIINNFNEIIEKSGRDSEHIEKYFLREAGVRGQIDKHSLILHSKFSPNILNKVIKKYFEEYVICPYCQKPDTQLEDDVLICKACGHRQKVKRL